MVSPLDQSANVLAEIQYFLWCDVLCADSNVRSHCLVAVSFYMQHPAEVWFGSPAQVWAAATSTEVKFLPVTCIKSRVAYSIRRYDFGRLIGEDKVIIATPLSTPLHS